LTAHGLSSPDWANESTRSPTMIADFLPIEYRGRHGIARE
jgi:hypothetical protein